MKFNADEMMKYVKENSKEFNGHMINIFIKEYESVCEREKALVNEIKKIQDDMLAKLDALKTQFDAVKANQTLLKKLISENFPKNIIDKK